MPLNKLLENGMKIKLFNEVKLSDLEQIFDNDSELVVIDYDRVKKIVTKSRNEPIELIEDNVLPCLSFKDCKSCDALKIFPEHDKVYFIEAKGFEKFIEFNLNGERLHEEVIAIIDNKIEKFNFRKKIEHSERTFHSCLDSFEIHLKEVDKEYIEKLVKDYIILLDIDIDEDISEEDEEIAEMLYLLEEISIRDKYQMIKKSIEKSIYDSNICSRINEPAIMRIKDLEEHFNQYKLVAIQ